MVDPFPLTFLPYKKQEYLAPGNEDLGAWSRRDRWRGEMWLDREGWREEEVSAVGL